MRRPRVADTADSSYRTRKWFALAPVRWLGVMGRIGIVSEHLCDDGTSDQRLQLGLELVRFVLLVDLLTADIQRKRLYVFCLLGRILDRFFGPFIKVVIFDAVGLGLADVIGESVELAFPDGIVPLQNIRQRGDQRSSWIAPRYWREFVAQGQPQLEFQVVGHSALPLCEAQPAR